MLTQDQESQVLNKHYGTAILYLRTNQMKWCVDILNGEQQINTQQLDLTRVRLTIENDIVTKITYG